jgi:AraC-like DNA-binding protein
MTDEHELPMLAGIAAILRWTEELLNIVNGPMLLFGAGVALVDLLTDGALTVSLPILLYGWATSQALGIDTQLLGCFARARNVHGWARWGWLVLGVILGYAAWQAGYVFAVQQAQRVSEAAALAQLHMDPALWLGWRAFLAVGLVALSGWTRYRKPAKVTRSLEDERAGIERELTLEPLRQQLRAQQVGGLRSLAVTALQGASAARASRSHASVSSQFEATSDHPTATAEIQQAALTSVSNAQHLPDEPPPSRSCRGASHRCQSARVGPTRRRCPTGSTPRYSSQRARHVAADYAGDSLSVADWRPRSPVYHMALLGGYSAPIARAIERLMRDFVQPLRMEQLAREVGMSVSGLHHRIKDVTALSPLQYQKRLRLLEARRLLLSEDIDATSAALRVGYTNASHFNREYKGFFSAPPMRDMRRLRDEALNRAG